MTKEQKLLNQMVKVTNKYCDLLEEFHKTMDERNYEYTEEQLEKLETLKDHTDTIYDNMSVIKDHQDVIVKTLEDIKIAIGYEEKEEKQKPKIYIVNECDPDNIIKDNKLCKELEDKLKDKYNKIIVVTEDIFENTIKMFKEEHHELREKLFGEEYNDIEHITHDQLVEMLNK